MKKIDLIRRYAELALNSFDTLDTEDAIGIAQANLRDLLKLLEAIETDERRYEALARRLN